MRIGNTGRVYGDSFTAFSELPSWRPLDDLSGDYLAELRIPILARDRLKDPQLGYAKTFLRLMEECIGPAHEAGVRNVENEGGLNTDRLAHPLHEVDD
ncbi:acyclic terpene utilization AtuA family protein, partial [Saccharothrix sp. ST-888]|uniref:acyclic terpene utilization AtuA family protein n=1 Tax=Saccharothrix sp. ST-888 TaxID=1427391 RepID=UPI0005ECA2BF